MDLSCNLGFQFAIKQLTIHFFRNCPTESYNKTVISTQHLFVLLLEKSLVLFHSQQLISVSMEQF